MTEDFRRDATEHMTFGEMKARDIDNVELVMKACKEVPFNSVDNAMKWTNNALQGIMLKFGIDKNGIIERAHKLPLDHFLVRQFVKAYNEDPKAPKPLKIDPRRLLAAKWLGIDQKKADVTVEPREYTNQKDVWRSGIYVYHHNEIAYFLSAPYRRKGGHYASPHILVPTFGKWFILTNYDPEEVRITV